MEKLVKEFNYFMSKGELQQANKIAEEMINLTKYSYDCSSKDYRGVRKEEMRQSEIDMWKKSLSYLKKPKEFMRFLDVGAGFGKDMFYANNILKIETYGIDNSKGFINILQERAKNGDFDSKLIFEGDMRKMECFKNEFFDLVRSNASLLHLPLIGKGYMADLAVEEFNRVLKPGGIVYLLLKYGHDLKIIDTKENLGKRIYQLYDEKTITKLLKRNGFEIVFINVQRRRRLDYFIDWINVIARKEDKKNAE